MGYKKDINLFKAAGGAVTKAKKMPLTKKLLIAMIAVVVICGAVIGILSYMNSTQNKELESLIAQKESYEFTKRLTQSLLKQYDDVEKSKTSLAFIEYYNEINSNMFSCLTEQELQAIKTYLTDNGYSVDYGFSNVSSEIRQQVVLAPYQLDPNDEDTAILTESYKFLYSALSSMIDYERMFADLPEQGDDIWYSYFRGQFFAVVKGSGDYKTLLSGLTDPETLGANPFLNLNAETATGSEKLFEAYGMTVTIEGEEYTLISITRRSNLERLYDAIEERIKIAIESDYDQTGVEYTYSIGKTEINTSEGTLTFNIIATQTLSFGLEDIVHAIDDSPFFKASEDLTFDFVDEAPTQEADLKFNIENSALDIMAESIQRMFAVSEETEGE